MLAMRYVTKVDAEGEIALPRLQLKQGTPIEVIVLISEDESLDLLAASETSLDFWNNPIDDEVWNDA